MNKYIHSKKWHREKLLQGVNRLGNTTNKCLIEKSE